MLRITQYIALCCVLFFTTPLLAQPLQTSLDEQLNEVKNLIGNNSSKEALEALQKIERSPAFNSIENQPIVYFYFTKYYLKDKDYDNALAYAKKALSCGEKASLSRSKAYGYYSMGNYHSLLDNNDLSVDYLLKALRFAEKTTDNGLLGDIYYRLYSIYTDWDDPEKTTAYAQKALTAYKKAKDYNGLSNAYNAKVWAMENKFKETQKEIYKDSATYFLYQSEAVYHQYPGFVNKRTHAIASLNLANHYLQKYYYENNLTLKEVKDSLNKYLQPLNTLTDGEDFDYSLRANRLGILAQLEMSNHAWDSAEKYLKKAKKHLTDSIYKPNYYTLFNVSVGLKELYKLKDDYRSAYLSLKDQYTYNQYIYDENQTKNVKALEAQYENEKIKQALSFEKKNNESKHTQLMLSLGLLLSALIAIVFMIRSFRSKMREKRQKLELLNKEKLETLNKIKLEEEKNARLSAEQKIMELEKEKISKKALANAMQIERKDEVLSDIQDKLKQNDVKLSEIRKTLKMEKRTTPKISPKYNEFNDINPLFFSELKALSNNQLTSLDLKYCAYFYLGLSHKEIAANLNIEPKSVRMTKYRIKKKLRLDKETPLEAFLEKLTF